MPSYCAICPTEFWLSALRSQGRSPATIASYARAVGQLGTWSGTDDLAAITRLQAIAFADHLRETHKPGGVAIAIRSLRAGWSWMLAEGLVDENVFARMKISVPDEPQRTATDDEIEHMLTHAKPNRRDFALLTMLVHTGARRGELAHVEMADVDMRSRMITFRISKTKARTVPLTEPPAAALGRWLRSRGVGQGNLWRVGDPYSLVNAAVQRHSKGSLRAHALRRAFAVRWLQQGGSEIGLQRIAGWTSPAMVRVYTRARADDLAADEMRRIFASYVPHRST